MNQTYGTDGYGRTYISGLPSPMRKDYKKPIMLEREILTSLNEVIPKRHCFYTNHANHRRTQSIMPTKETSLWLISFLASPRCLVSRSQESFNSSAIFAEFSRAERMTWFDFASNIGGITGVTLGISFVSLLEVFYWVVIRFCRNLIKNKA